MTNRALFIQNTFLFNLVKRRWQKVNDKVSNFDYTFQNQYTLFYCDKVFKGIKDREIIYVSRPLTKIGKSSRKGLNDF